MDKKTCCGCFGCGCFVVIAAFLIGGYMGVDFLHGKGVEFAASGLIQTVDKLTEMAFADADRAEINKAAAVVADKIRSGEIGLIEVIAETGQKLENNLHNQAMLLAFYRQNYEPGEKPAVEGAEATEATVPAEAAEPAELVDRLIFGMINKNVTKDQAASITAVLVERHTETVESKDGSGRITTSSRRLKKSLTPEDKAASLELMRKICNENNLPLPGADFDRTAAVKQELLNFFADLQKAGKKE